MVDGLEISSGAFELLPLLKLIWNHAQAKCEFAFVSGSSLSQERNNGAGYHDPITAADLMNRALVELGTADVLNLRQYAKYSGLISSIMIWHHEDDRFGYVEYKDSTIPHSFPHPGRCFDISDHGSKIQWKESEQLSLLSLTYEFLSAIKPRGYRIGLSGVNSLLRGDIDHMHTRVYDEIVVRMSTQEARTDFNNFKALRKLLEVGNFDSLVNNRREKDCFINMILMFKLSIPEPTADLRININKLLLAFNSDHGSLVITVQGPDSSMKDTQSVRWQHIQTAVFLLLSDVSEQYPSKTHQPLPQIRINGCGTILGWFIKGDRVYGGLTPQRMSHGRKQMGGPENYLKTADASSRNSQKWTAKPGDIGQQRVNAVL
ncbi:hypothetical protein J4E90_004446 [Alternaria incomplexa]|uniref:uncharacterized protein n=1 Tax=Alternaria incomplexa TaxID=1187928 RepID=UPI00221E772D|nr:uncharacterized protein J4E90_004446 [Alternaria incomplexa]KAI4916000.1 hypothetical protein J4E90_004446 [Alternaria incomplexa]